MVDEPWGDHSDYLKLLYNPLVSEVTSYKGFHTGWTYQAQVRMLNVYLYENQAGSEISFDD
jgi:hypothetical protein